MPLLDVFDHRFAAAGGPSADDADERRHRVELLRGRLQARVVEPTGWDEHSLAVPVIGAYLERALSLYVLGFHEACILELHARLAGTMRVLAGAEDEDLERLLALPVIVRALAPAGDSLLAALYAIARKRRDLRARQDELARSILVDSPANGAAGGGYGAIIADSPTSTRVRWGADLHDLCAQAVRACCLLIEASRRGTAAADSAATKRQGATTDAS